MCNVTELDEELFKLYKRSVQTDFVKSHPQKVCGFEKSNTGEFATFIIYSKPRHARYIINEIDAFVYCLEESHFI